TGGDNKDVWQNAIRGHKTFHECWAACLDEKDCMAFVYKKKLTVDSAEDNCLLKSRLRLETATYTNDESACCDSVLMPPNCKEKVKAVKDVDQSDGGRAPAQPTCFLLDDADRKFAVEQNDPSADTFAVEMTAACRQSKQTK
ncbi:unnamed protein product, partial [Amoebophrya sp. A120]